MISTKVNLETATSWPPWALLPSSLNASLICSSTKLLTPLAYTWLNFTLMGMKHQSLSMTSCLANQMVSLLSPHAVMVNYGSVYLRKPGRSSMARTRGPKVVFLVSLPIILWARQPRALIMRLSKALKISLRCWSQQTIVASRWWPPVMDKVKTRTPKESSRATPTPSSQSMNSSTKVKMWSYCSWGIHGEPANGRETGQTNQLSGRLKSKKKWTSKTMMMVYSSLSWMTTSSTSLGPQYALKTTHTSMCIHSCTTALALKMRAPCPKHSFLLNWDVPLTLTSTPSQSQCSNKATDLCIIERKTSLRSLILLTSI